MMFLLDLAFAMELIALGLGISMLIWAYRNEGAGVALGKVFGYVISILAVLALLCTSYYGTQYWKEGYFKSPIAPMLMMKQQMMQHKGMMRQQRRMQQRRRPMPQ